MELKITVDLDAIRQNASYFKARAAAKLLLMVKADAYGHGLIPVAKAAENIVDFFGVATVEEGEKLRNVGISKPILVTVFSAVEAETAVRNDLSVGVFEEAQIVALERICSNSRLDFAHTPSAKVHVKIDTGMNRLGVKTKGELERLLKAVKGSKHVEVEGCYSHRYNDNKEQEKLFFELSRLVKAKYKDCIIHLSASEAVLKNGADGLDMVRAGIAAYGYGSAELKPAMRVKTEVISAKRVKRGEHTGYGEYVAERDTCVAVVFGGYADGVRRMNKGAVELNGERCKILGVPCMDMTIIDTGDYLASQNDVAFFLSRTLNADEIAEAENTIPYEVLTGFGHARAEKVYLSGANKSDVF